MVTCAHCGKQSGWPPFTCSLCYGVTVACPCCKGTGSKKEGCS